MHPIDPYRDYEEDPYEPEDHLVEGIHNCTEVYERWADPTDALPAFDKAGHWAESLEELEIVGRLWSPHKWVSPPGRRGSPALRPLVHKPRNLRALRLPIQSFECYRSVNPIIRLFPTLVRVYVHCLQVEGAAFSMYPLFQDLHVFNRNIKSLSIVGDYETFEEDEDTDGEDGPPDLGTLVACLQGLGGQLYYRHWFGGIP